MRPKTQGAIVGAVAIIVTVLQAPSAADSLRGRSPLEELPPHIKRITHFGQRADFSHDARKILFLERTFGDVFEVEVATGIVTPVTHHFFHEGFTRALYLSNGDILLSGSRTFDATNPWPSRSERQAELWVLDKDLTSPPAPTPTRPRCRSHRSGT